jgi:YidC/Oxa1 family membrane protein insertase
METRNLIVALAGALLVYVLWMSIYTTYFAPPPPKPGGPAPATEPAIRPDQATTAPASAPGTRPAFTTPSAFEFEAAAPAEPVTLGRQDDVLRVGLDSMDASVTTIHLTAKDEKGRYVHRVRPDGNEPYAVIAPVQEDDRTCRSYVTRKLWIGDQAIDMQGVVWTLVEHDDHHAIFETTLRTQAGAPLLRLRKTYTLRREKPLMDLGLDLENLTAEPMTIAIEQDGPVGVRSESIVYGMRRVVAGLRKPDGKIEVKAADARKLRRAQNKGEPFRPYSPQSEVEFVWTALTNRYFAVFTRPIDANDQTAQVIGTVQDELAVPENPQSDRGDLLARLQTHQREAPPGKRVTFTFEVYAGTKDEQDLKQANPAYAGDLDYAAVQYADVRCCCEFLWLKRVMIGLLDAIHVVVPNYGVAIMIVVVIVRTLLHPLAVFQQKSMYRAQEAQARLQPKMQEVKEKYANDRVKQNQEMMRIYSEEGVNPMAPMVGMLPMLLQMPILIALWRGISTDIHLRHAPFDGWWINDLSAPDALIKFGGDGVTIPVLGWLPLIGHWFQHVPSLNALPILMGVSMWLQQRYMPKPHMEAKLKAAREAEQAGKKPESGLGGMSVQDQMRQQYMMANIMAVMFPLMFYYFPSGLSLYWLATNVVGILESLRIRKQIEADKQRRQALGIKVDQKPRKKGPIGRWIERMAQQAGELQKRADEVSGKKTRPAARRGSEQGPKPGKPQPKKGRRKGRP